MSLAGAPHDQIIDAVRKTDGTSPSLRAVSDILAHKRDHPEWRGENTQTGRPKLLTDAPREQLVDLVFAERGKAKVTVKFCKKRLRFLRAVGRHTVERELQDAGHRWLRRRGKTLVPGPVKVQRVEYAESLKRKWQSVFGSVCIHRWHDVLPRAVVCRECGQEEAGSREACLPHGEREGWALG